MTITEYIEHYYQIITEGDLDELEHLYAKNSPFFTPTKQQYEQMRSQLTLKIDIISIELVSQLEDLIIVRDKIRFEGRAEGREISNITENLHIIVNQGQGWGLQLTNTLKLSMDESNDGTI